MYKNILNKILDKLSQLNQTTIKIKENLTEMIVSFRKFI